MVVVARAGVFGVAPRATGASVGAHNKQRSPYPQSVTRLGAAPFGGIRREDREGAGTIPFRPRC